MSSSADLASLVAQAREALAARHLDTAIEAAGRALKVEPRCVDAYLVRAEAHRRTNKYERALADLAVAVRLAPDRPGPYIVRAEILKRRNVFDQAVADATHALILDPRNASAFSIRAQCRHAVGDREGAADDVRAMLDVDPTRAVPDLPAAVASPPSPTAILDERFWKEPGDGRRPDDPTLFADGKPVDRTYRSRRTIADEDAPEELGAASGYRPEVVLAPLPRTRTARRRSLSRSGGLATLAFGALLGAAGVFWALHRTPEPIAARAKSPSPASVSAGPKADAGYAAVEDSKHQAPPAPAEIDLLQMVDLSRALTGAWGRRDRVLAVTPDGTRPAVMTFSQTVVDEYDLEVRAELDKPGLILVGLVHGGVRITACLHSEFGKYWLQQFDGQATQDNESTRRGPILRPGEAATFRCSVRKGGVVVSSQGRRLIDWKGDYSRFTDRPLALVDLPKQRTLFLASWVPARFTTCRLTSISSDDESPSIPRMTASAKPIDPVGKWVELRPGTPGGDRVRTFAADGTFVLESPKQGKSVVGTWRSEAGRVYFSHPSQDGVESPTTDKWFTISIQDQKTMTILMDGVRKYVWYKSS